MITALLIIVIVFMFALIMGRLLAAMSPAPADVEPIEPWWNQPTQTLHTGPRTRRLHGERPAQYRGAHRPSERAGRANG